MYRQYYDGIRFSVCCWSDIGSSFLPFRSVLSIPKFRSQMSQKLGAIPNHWLSSKPTFTTHTTCFYDYRSSFPIDVIFGTLHPYLHSQENFSLIKIVRAKRDSVHYPSNIPLSNYLQKLTSTSKYSASAANQNSSFCTRLSFLHM